MKYASLDSLSPAGFIYNVTSAGMMSPQTYAESMPPSWLAEGERNTGFSDAIISASDSATMQTNLKQCRCLEDDMDRAG